MDRQLNNLYQPPQKGQSLNDCQPGPARPNSKCANKFNNFYRDTNKFGSKTRAKQPNKSCSRESKFFNRLTLDASQSYLVDSRSNYLPEYYNRKKVPAKPKLSIKERFVQANCQFVIPQSKDCSEHLKNPDIPIAWDSVEEVIFACNSEDFCCPICLYSPLAAKITRCGHIFCWSCILHYLSLSDKESRSCPICFDVIQKCDLKSVCVIKKVDYTTNCCLTFRLMKIKKGSAIALPVNHDTKYEYLPVNLNSDESLDMFSKIFVASYQQIRDIIERENNELLTLLLEYQNENMPEVCFIESALQELELRKIEIGKKESFYKKVEVDYFNVSKNSKSAKSADDYTYFYQSSDGQHIYLHSFNNRMLKHEFEELKNAPEIISGKIVEMHHQSVTEDVRKRIPFVRHLPISCEFKVVEVDFDETVLSKETLQVFKQEIINRHKQRKRKEKVQKRRDLHIDIENKRKIYGITPAPDFHLDNCNDFPAYQTDPLLDVQTDIAVQQNQCQPSTSSNSFQSSFANMLAQGKSHFSSDLPKKNSTLGIQSGDDSNDESLLQSMNTITLADYLDNCIIKTSKKKKGKK